MKKFLSIILVFLGGVSLSQTSAFEKYGPYGSEIHKDLKKALKVADGVYRMDLSYQAVEPKFFNKIGKFKNLQALQLSSNGLTQFPDDFSKLNSLLFFASINNDFTRFPKDMYMLHNLCYLELFGCKIDSIPNEISALEKLKILHVGNISDTLRITNKLKLCDNLQELAFESVVLDSCPKQLFRIPSLKFLSLSNTQIHAMPQNLDKLGNLEVLILDFNNISELPRSIYKCKKLIHLSLKNNKLTRIPDTICHLQNLTQLDLRGNNIPKADIEEVKALLPGCKVLY